MRQDYEFSYRNDGSASYLTVVPKDGAGFVRYQIKMVENNRIAHLLPLTAAERDGRWELFYEVTSCVPLGQLLSRRKMEKGEFLSLADGLVRAGKELPEYQLPAGGLLLEEDMVFVRPGDFEVRFLYLPDGAEEETAAPIRDFLSGLVMKNSLAPSAGPLIPALLELLNRPELSLEMLQRFVQEQKAPAAHSAQSPAGTPAAPVNPPVQKPRPAPPRHTRPPVAFDPQQFTGQETEKAEKPAPKPSREPPSAPPAIVQPEKKAKKKGTSPQRLLFLVLQGVWIIAIGLLLQNGMLADAGGALAVDKLAGVLLVCAGLDFLLARRLFPKTTPEKRTENKAKKAEKPASHRPTPPAPPKAPAAAPSRPPQPAKAPQAPVRPPKPAAPQAPAPQAAPPVRAAQPMGAAAPVYEETVMMDEAAAGEPRLSYYENGLVRRVPIRDGRILVGKQQGQVDLVLSSPRISHVHAEFRQEGGGFVVVDCNSKNGTYINGSRERITSYTPYPLQNGDTVRLADVELTFEC